MSMYYVQTYAVERVRTVFSTFYCLVINMEINFALYLCFTTGNQIYFHCTYHYQFSNTELRQRCPEFFMLQNKLHTNIELKL